MIYAIIPVAIDYFHYDIHHDTNGGAAVNMHLQITVMIIWSVKSNPSLSLRCCNLYERKLKHKSLKNQ